VLVSILFVVLGLSQLIFLHLWTSIEDVNLELEQTKKALSAIQAKDRQHQKLPALSSSLLEGMHLVQLPRSSSRLPFTHLPSNHSITAPGSTQMGMETRLRSR